MNPVETQQSDYRLLVESIPDYAIYFVELDGTIRTWNNGAKRIFGYEAAEVLGKNSSRFYTPEGNAENRSTEDLRIAKQAGSHEVEGWRLRKDGSRFWANAVLTPIFDDQGVHVGFGKVTRDFTERRKSDARYRLLVGSVKDYGIFMLDPTGVVLSWNLGAELIKGYKASEIIGRHFRAFYTKKDVDARHPEDELQKAIQNGRFEEEGWRVRKDGTQFWANVVITPLIDDNKVLVGFSKVTRDLTARMRAEKELRESEEKLRLIMDSVKDYAIVMLDTTGHIASWNAGAERIKGWKESEILGVNFESFYPEEDLAMGKAKNDLEAAKKDGRVENFGWRIRKDGSQFWANVVITALRDESGTLHGFSKVTRDITERKINEEALQKAYEELESFSYSVSHDLRAPLRSMNGFSEILLATVSDQLDEKSRGYLSRIRESSQRMAQLIDDLLNLSRLSREPLSQQKVNLSELATKILNEIQKSQPERQVTIRVQPNIVVDADPVLMQVVLENLLRNAWKYTSKTPNSQVEFGAEVKRRVRHYFVKDNGAGFDMAYREKLFGAFQRLHGVNEFPGTGIGLASVKRIVHRHGGEVHAIGEPHKGATFSFTLGTQEVPTE